MNKILTILFLSTAIGMAGTRITHAQAFDQSMSLGMSGTRILQLQEFLTTQDCFHVNPTGYFGLITLQAVKCFQSNNELPVTGYFGIMSRTAADTILALMVDPAVQAQRTETGTTTPADLYSGSSSNPYSGSSGSVYQGGRYSGYQRGIGSPAPYQSVTSPLTASAPNQMLTFTIGTPVCVEGIANQVPPVTIEGSWRTGKIKLDSDTHFGATYDMVNTGKPYSLPELIPGTYTYYAVIDGAEFTGSFTVAPCL